LWIVFWRLSLRDMPPEVDPQVDHVTAPHFVWAVIDPLCGSAAATLPPPSRVMGGSFTTHHTIGGGAYNHIYVVISPPPMCGGGAWFRTVGAGCKPWFTLFTFGEET
jgi:hypothetical protein